MRRIATAIGLLILVAGPCANAAEIKALITTAMQAAIVELVPPFERATGHKVTVSYDPSGGLARRLRSGEFRRHDPHCQHRTRPADRRPARSRTGPTYRAPASGLRSAKARRIPTCRRPTRSNARCWRQNQSAKPRFEGGSITALHVQRVLSELGIREQVSSKLKLAAGGPNGRVSVLVASGEAEIGLQQVSELMSNPDVDVIGHAARHVAADHHQRRGHHRRRQGARRRARVDTASHDAGGAGDLQGQGLRALRAWDSDWGSDVLRPRPVWRYGSDHHAIGLLTHAVDRLLLAKPEIFMSATNVLANSTNRRRRALRITDRDRHIVIAARQDARSRQRRQRGREHRHDVAEGVRLPGGDHVGGRLRGLDRDAEHGGVF